MENQKFRSENQMVHAIPFGRLHKIWAVIWSESTFKLFLASSVDFDMYFVVVRSPFRQIL